MVQAQEPRELDLLNQASTTSPPALAHITFLFQISFVYPQHPDDPAKAQVHQVSAVTRESQSLILRQNKRYENKEMQQHETK